MTRTPQRQVGVTAGSTGAMMKALEEVAGNLQSPRLGSKELQEAGSVASKEAGSKELLEEDDEPMERREENAGELQEHEAGSVNLQEQGGSVLRILSTLTPWYRLSRRQEQDVTGSVELQEENLEAGSADLRGLEAGSGDLQEKETGSAKLQEAVSVDLQEQETVSVEFQEKETGSGELQEAGSRKIQEAVAKNLQEPETDLEEKMRKNLELFETSIKKPDVASTLSLFDELPERRGSYKLLYEHLKEEVLSLKSVIENGSAENSRMKDVIERGRKYDIDRKEYIIKLEKTVAACDVSMTEKLLTDNERLRNLNNALEEKVAKLQSEQTESEDVIKVFTEAESLEEVEDKEEEEVQEESTNTMNHDILSLATMKESGHERTSPQESFKPKPKPRTSLLDKQFKCLVCKLVCNTEEKLQRHMVNHDEDGDWTCDGCSYQSREQNDLLNHLLEKRDHSTALLDHLLNKNIYDRRDKCTICGELFGSKTELHNHLNTKHKTYKPCNKMPACDGEGCRYNHDEVTPGAHLCYQCGDEYASKIELMNHMKSTHVMPFCKHYKKGNCTFNGRCWYSHMRKDHDSVAKSTQPKPKDPIPNIEY